MGLTIDTDLINLHAMCRECAKEFMTTTQPARLYRVIQKHMEENPGHVVIGTEQTRVIFKDRKASTCTSR